MSRTPHQSLTRSAFEQSVASAFPVVFNRVVRRFGDEQLAEEVSLDCLSQAFELWQTDPAYFATHDLTAWSSRRAGWRALDRLRERARNRPLPEEPRLEDEQDRSSTWLAVPRQRTEPEDVTRDRQITWRALSKLAPEDRAILTSWYYDQLSDQEIGTALFGEENGTIQARGLRVWRRRQRAQARLRDILIKDGIDPQDWGATAQAV